MSDEYKKGWLDAIGHAVQTGHLSLVQARFMCDQLALDPVEAKAHLCGWACEVALAAQRQAESAAIVIRMDADEAAEKAANSRTTGTTRKWCEKALIAERHHGTCTVHLQELWAATRPHE